MKDEIKETLNELESLFEISEAPEHIIKGFNKIKYYITNLQQENQDIKDTLQDKLDYIGHLKELCVKYEEEHNTKFNDWVFDKRENERLTQGVTLLTNKLIDMKKENENLKIDNKRLQHNEKVFKSRNKKAIEYIKIGLANEEESEELLNILNGNNK